jgi:hypothetical protein
MSTLCTLERRAQADQSPADDDNAFHALRAIDIRRLERVSFTEKGAR